MKSPISKSNHTINSTKDLMIITKWYHLMLNLFLLRLHHWHHIFHKKHEIKTVFTKNEIKKLLIICTKKCILVIFQLWYLYLDWWGCDWFTTRPSNSQHIYGRTWKCISSYIKWEYHKNGGALWMTIATFKLNGWF